MANPEHLAILKQGVIEGNQWREEHPEVHADLGKAHLSWLDLRGADFRYVDLQSAELEQPGLSADLTGADLRHADLRDAMLRRANLRSAKLNGAHMSGADFRRANLGGADLRGQLDAANFSEAILPSISKANQSSIPLPMPLIHFLRAKWTCWCWVM